MSEKNTTKKAWVKPEITPLRNGLANKFGSVRNVNWCDSIDDVPFDKLIRSYGSPLFVASEQKLRSNIKRIKNAFSSRYPRIQLAWSYKTNYLGAICNVLHQEDAWADLRPNGRRRRQGGNRHDHADPTTGSRRHGSGRGRFQARG